MMTSLGLISDVCMGVTLRGRDATRPVLGGSCRMIRISDITDDGHLSNPELLEFDPSETIKRSLFLRAGDVLFPNRGTRTTAYVFNLAEKNVIVGAQFFIIRPDTEVVLPEYIAWYLRSEVAAQHFHLRRKGTLVQTVQRKDLTELELPLPSIDKQRILVALDDLAIQERQLSQRLSELNFSYLQHKLLTSSSQS